MGFARSLTQLAAAAVLLGGCSGTQSTAQLGAAPSPLQMYPLPADAADKILATAMSVELVGSPISRVDLPNRGYRATLRSSDDWYHIQAYMIPAIGRDSAGATIDGYVFEVGHSGTMPLSERSRAGRILARIVAKAEARAPSLPFVAFKR